MPLSKPKLIRLIEKLQEQLRFIQRSCEIYDRGSEDEALRLATHLRIIFHNTSNSVSLVANLRLDSKKILSSSRGYGDWTDYLAHEIDLTSPQPIRMLPLLGDKFKDLSITDWWGNEPVFIYNSQRYTRRKIILTAANQDGGAHVDKKLDKYYEFLCAGEYAFGLMGNLEYDGEPPFPQGVIQYPKNAHLALIRQFAQEILVSVAHFSWLDGLSEQPER